jgi:hypothetical protein
VTGIRGDVSECNITDAERNAGVSIVDLLK